MISFPILNERKMGSSSNGHFGCIQEKCVTSANDLMTEELKEELQHSERRFSVRVKVEFLDFKSKQFFSPGCHQEETMKNQWESG